MSGVWGMWTAVSRNYVKSIEVDANNATHMQRWGFPPLFSKLVLLLPPKVFPAQCLLAIYSENKDPGTNGFHGKIQASLLQSTI